MLFRTFPSFPQHVPPSRCIPCAPLYEEESLVLHKVPPGFSLTLPSHFIPIDTSRSFSSSRPTFLNSLDTLSDDEEMFRDSGAPRTFPGERLVPLTPMVVRRFAKDVVAPKVREMDENEMMDPVIIKELFEQGVRLISSLDVVGLIIANP